jgi:hypothetical protein
LNILQKKCRVDFSETNSYQDTKGKNDTVIINDQSMQKKLKQHDHLISHQNDENNLVNLESEEDGE